MPDGDRGAARHYARLQRTLGAMFAFILLCMAVATAALGLGAPGTPGVVAHLAVALAEIAVAVHVLVRGVRVSQVVVLLACVAVLSPPALRGPGDFSIGLAITACALGAARVRDGRAYVAVLAVAALVFVVGVLAGGESVAFTELSTVLMAAANLVAAVAFVATLERSTRAIDAAEADAAEQRRLVVRADQLDHAVDGARRVLHDDVLAALGAIENGAPTTRRQAEAAVRAIDELTGRAETDAVPVSRGSGVDGLVAALRVESPVPFDLDLTVDRTAGVLGEPTVAVLRRSLLELLRNVQRHAGVDHARLEIGTDGAGWSFTVRDEGAGFAPGAVEGYGLTHSVRAAVASIGGRVSVTTSAAGTAVRVDVVPPAAPRQGSLTDVYRLTLSAGGQQRLAWSTAVPFVVSWWIVGGQQVAVSDQRVPGLVLLLLTSGMVVAVAHRMSMRAPTRRWMAGLTVALTALNVLGLVCLPAGGLLDFRSWSTGFLAVVLLIMCFVLPVRWGLALIVLESGVLLAAVAISPQLSSGTVPIGSLNAWIASPLLTMLLGVGMRRNARTVERQSAEAERASTELMRRRLLQEVSSLHLDHTRAVIAPWLARVADGELDPAATEVRTTAGLLGQEARDDLHAPGFHDPALRGAVTSYRRRGGSVTIRPGFAPGAAARTSGRLLRRLVTVLPPEHRVTISPPASDAGDVRVVVLPPPPGQLLAGLDRLGARETARDAFAVVLELPDRTAEESALPEDVR